MEEGRKEERKGDDGRKVGGGGARGRGEEPGLGLGAAGREKQGEGRESCSEGACRVLIT